MFPKLWLANYGSESIFVLATNLVLETMIQKLRAFVYFLSFKVVFLLNPNGLSHTTRQAPPLLKRLLRTESGSPLCQRKHFGGCLLGQLSLLKQAFSCQPQTATNKARLVVSKALPQGCHLHRRILRVLPDRQCICGVQSQNA